MLRDPSMDVVKNIPGRVGLQQPSVNGVLLYLKRMESIF